MYYTNELFRIGMRILSHDGKKEHRGNDVL